MQNRTADALGCYDVVVCGGGPAGFIAATACAHAGARVALVEKNAFLGGLATAGLVNPISEFNKNGVRVIDGLPWQFVEMLAALGGAELGYPIGNVPFDPEVYKLAAQRMVLNAGVQLFLDSCLTGCQQNSQGGITQVALCGMSGSYTLKAAVFVDCTGDARLAQMAEVPMQPTAANGLQPATLCFRLGGVNTEHLENIRFKEPNTRYANARVRWILEALRSNGEDVPIFGGPWFHWGLQPGVVTVNMTRAAVDPNSAQTVSDTECRLREDVFRFAALLRRHVPEFRDCFLMDTGQAAGYRESRRIVGAHTLSGDEFLSGEYFEDTVACSAHPIDIHRNADSGQDVRFLDRVGYIPYRCLYNTERPNLLTAGRCISADEVAFASVRIQAACMATGQAAGVAAALCAAHGLPVHALDTALLKDVLLAQQALL